MVTLICIYGNIILGYLLFGYVSISFNKREVLLMKRQLFILIALIITIIACDVSEGKEVDLAPLFEGTQIELTNFEHHDSPDISPVQYKVDEYKLNSDDGYSIYDQTAYGDKIYYIMAEENMGVLYESVEIFVHDVKENTTNVLYKHSGDEPVIFAELRATENYLFYVELYAGKFIIKKHNLSTNQASIIHSSEQANALNTPLLSHNEKYVAWFENTLAENDNDERTSLYLYSIAEENLSVIEEDVTFQADFSRPNIRGNHLVYRATYPGDEINKINIVNLETNETQSILIPGKVQNILSNGEITVWHEDYHQANIYYYDHLKEEVYMIHSKKSNELIFAIDLLKNNILVNFSEDSTGNHNIYTYNVETQTSTNLTQNEAESTGYYLTNITADEKFIAQSGDIESIQTLLMQTDQ